MKAETCNSNFCLLYYSLINECIRISQMSATTLCNIRSLDYLSIFQAP
jgi:hypothetical protein